MPSMAAKLAVAGTLAAILGAAAEAVSAQDMPVISTSTPHRHMATGTMDRVGGQLEFRFGRALTFKSSSPDRSMTRATSARPSPAAI